MNTTLRPSTVRREIGEWMLNGFGLLAGLALAAPFVLILSSPFLGVW